MASTLSVHFGLEFRVLKRTPARTLVMSSTLMPANGSVGVSVVAVAMVRYLKRLEPLGCDEDTNRIA